MRSPSRCLPLDRPIVRVDRSLQLREGQRIAGLAAADHLAAVRRRQMPRVEVDAPATELPSLKAKRRRSSLACNAALRCATSRLQVVPVALKANQSLAFQRHVKLGREKIGELTFLVEHRRDEQAVPKCRAVSPVVLRSSSSIGVQLLMACRSRTTSARVVAGPCRKRQFRPMMASRS